MFVIASLLYQCGDVETNPGPSESVHITHEYRVHAIPLQHM